MDFNDDRSIFSNSQLALDNSMQNNINQNDYLQNNYDAHVMQFFVDDSPMLNVPNQYEHPPAPPNVLCSPNQASSNSNPLKAQNAHHQSQPNLNSNNNRSRGLAQPPPQHHPSYQQPPPQQLHNQFHNQAQPTSKPQFISNVPLNQQPLNYVNIPKDNKSMIYSEVVNHSNVLNNPNCNVYNGTIHNNGINGHPMHRPRQLQHPPHPQQMNMIQQQPNNSLPPMKNGNNGLLNDQQKPAGFYSPPPNYYNLSPQPNTNLQQPSPINNTMNSNPINSMVNNSMANNSMSGNSMANNAISKNAMNNSMNCFVEKKSPPISVNGLNNGFFAGDLANRNNLIKPSIVEKVPPDQAISIHVGNNAGPLNSFSNSISSPSTSSQQTPSSQQHSTTPKKSQISELNSSLTVHHLESKTKQKAETKTVVIFKIVDQVVVNGQVVSETVVKNEEVVKHTGYIDWPVEAGNQSQASVESCRMELGETKTECVSKPNTVDRTGSPAGKKNAAATTPKAGKNLKRSSAGLQAKEKKIKIDVEQKSRSEPKSRTDSPIKYKVEQQPKRSPTVALKEPATSVSTIVSNTETDPAAEEPNKAIVPESSESGKSIPEVQSIPAETKSIPEINVTTPESGSEVKQPEFKQQESKQQLESKQPESKQQPESSPAPNTPAAQHYEIEDPIFKPIDVDQRVLAKWTDRNWYSGKVLAKENDSKWRILFDDGGRRLIRENEIMCLEFIPNGQKVMAMVNYQAHFCLKGIVKSRRVDESSGECFYTVEHYSNAQCYETEYISKDVFLNGEHALALLSRRKQNVNDSKFADVDLNNIIPKRSRASIKGNLNDSSNGPPLNEKANSLSAEFEDNDSNSNLSCSTNASSATTSSASKKSGKKIKSTGKQPNASSNEESLSSVNAGASKSSSSSEPKVDCVKSETPESKPEAPDETSRLNDSFEDNLIGPIPNSTSELFKSFAFLLSFEDQKPSDNEVAGYSIPFDINHLTKQITNGSGLILDSYDDIKENYQVVLVSHSYLKTVKYMMCLSSGIPCIKFTWIIDSCKKNQLLSYVDYVLPSGFSILTNNLLQDRNIYKKSQMLFKGTKIFLTPSDSELTAKWLPLFGAARATLLDHLPDTTTRTKPTCDLVVTDSSCDPELLKKVNALRVPVVSIEYIIQCLIHGKRLNVDSHPSFSHNYVSS